MLGFRCVVGALLLLAVALCTFPSEAVDRPRRRIRTSSSSSSTSSVAAAATATATDSAASEKVPEAITMQQRRTQTSIVQTGNNGSPSSAYPMGLCEGDCDSDADCDSDLVCYQREAYESVPGCSGGESETVGNDYCVSSNSVVAATASSTTPLRTLGTFRLKMYWQTGTRWQGELFERKWCMRCYQGHCDPGAPAIIANCDNGGPAELVFEVYDGNEFRVRVQNTNTCLEIPADWDFYVSWQACSNSDLQRFIGQNGDPFSGARFELVPKTIPVNNCLTITHHPSTGERLWVATCDYARQYNTSYWVPY